MTATKEKKVLAWHFSGRRLDFKDNRVVKAGRTYSVPGPVVLCSSGLHASIKLIDAAHYKGSSPILSRVEVWGGVTHEPNRSNTPKLAGLNRKVLWTVDAVAFRAWLIRLSFQKMLKSSKVTKVVRDSAGLSRNKLISVYCNLPTRDLDNKFLDYHNRVAYKSDNGAAKFASLKQLLKTAAELGMKNPEKLLDQYCKEKGDGPYKKGK